MIISNRIRAAAAGTLFAFVMLGLQACNRNEPKSEVTSPSPPGNTAAPGSGAGSTPSSMDGNTPPATPAASSSSGTSGTAGSSGS